MESQLLADSIRNIPPVTRFFTISTLMVCLANSLRIIEPSQLVCNLWVFVYQYAYTQKILNHTTSIFEGLQAILLLIAQCYRFLACFLKPAGIPQSPFNAIMDIYFFYTFANHVERIKFKGSFPDCLWFTLVTGTIIVIETLIYSFFDPQYIPCHHLMMLSCITYIFSRYEKNSVINFLGILPIKAYYLPLFNLGVKLIIQGYWACFDSVFGILGGYLYQCLQSDTLPIYNLFPQFYPQFYPRATGNKVGTINMNSANADIILDSIFDKGYLRAPLWLYNVLKYPVADRQRETSMSQLNKRPTTTQTQQEDSSTAYSTGWFSSDNAFKGKGHRLGD